MLYLDDYDIVCVTTHKEHIRGSTFICTILFSVLHLNLTIESTHSISFLILSCVRMSVCVCERVASE